MWSPEGTGVTITGHGEPEEVARCRPAAGSSRRSASSPRSAAGFRSKRTPLARRAPRCSVPATGSAGLAATPRGGPGISSTARPHQIIGVMPAHFNFGGEFDVLLPLRINPARPVPFSI